MNFFWKLLMSAAACTVSACAAMLEKPDPMCSEIATFANSASDDSVHSVELTTDWGARFSDDKNAVWAKHCQHNDYPPGKQLCSYLMENTSTEFDNVNFRRALACLDASRYAGSSDVTMMYMNTELWSSSAKHVKEDRQVGIKYTSGTDTSPPLLTILTQRFPAR